MKTPDVKPLDPDLARWQVRAEEIPASSTEEVDPATVVYGQDRAMSALRFAIECPAADQNVYARGTPGTGRLSAIRQALDEVKPAPRQCRDFCYVQRFTRRERPRLLELPAQTSREFRSAMRHFADYLKDQFEKEVNSEQVVAQRNQLSDEQEARAEELLAALRMRLKQAGLGLVQQQGEKGTRRFIVPLLDGEPVTGDAWDAALKQGQVTEKQTEALRKKAREFSSDLAQVESSIGQLRQTSRQQVGQLMDQVAGELVTRQLEPIRQRWPGQDVADFLDEVRADIVDTRLNPSDDPKDPVERYGVNIVHEASQNDVAPVIVEQAPSLDNLIGGIDALWTSDGRPSADYRGIRAGSMVHADGGFLIIDAQDLLSEKHAWKSLVRCLRFGAVEPGEGVVRNAGPVGVKPDEIPVSLRAIIIGDSGTYYKLDRYSSDFRELFKVLADFKTTIAREDGIGHYLQVIAKIVQNNDLRHFDASAVAALIEHGARVAARRGALTARFSRIADLAFEASYLAGRDDRDLVSGGDVIEAVRRTKYRANLPSERFDALIEEGVIELQVKGAVTGQINGLAVIHAGPLTYGFPARITATIGPGKSGVINIEGQSALSGSIHTKGFHILGGLLRHLLPTDHPLTFSASIAFEQSYGGIDGDSASGAELCCLISALAQAPLRQGVAMTGAIDQHGRIEAIGGANEKIEGFFDACKSIGRDDDQGVIIPASNVGDLMLRRDVVEAIRAGTFAVWPVHNVGEALAVLTGRQAGKLDQNNDYPPQSVLGEAMARAQELWQQSQPPRLRD